MRTNRGTNSISGEAWTYAVQDRLSFLGLTWNQLRESLDYGTRQALQHRIRGLSRDRAEDHELLEQLAASLGTSAEKLLATAVSADLDPQFHGRTS